MDNQLHWDLVTLAPGALLRLHDAAGTRVVCVQGELWLTEPGDPLDHFLRTGADHRITAGGLVLVEATCPSRLMVLPD